MLGAREGDAEMKDYHRLLGYAAIVTAAAMWGVGGTVAKILFNTAVSPFLLVKVRLSVAFLLLFISLASVKRDYLRITRQDMGYFAILGVAGMAMVQFTYFLTISLTNVATAVFLQYLAPIFMALYARFGERMMLGWQRVVAVALAVLGGLCIMLAAGSSGRLTWLGLGSGLASALFMAFNTIYGRRGVQNYHPLTVVTYAFGFGATFWWLISPGLDWRVITAQWLMFGYVAVFATVIPFLLYFVALRFISPTGAGITASLEPVIAAVVAYGVLGEIMGAWQIVGSILVVGAVVLLQLAPPEQKMSARVAAQVSGK